MTPIPPVNHVDVDYDFPLTFLVMAPGTDGSSKNAVDVVREFQLMSLQLIRSRVLIFES